MTVKNYIIRGSDLTRRESNGSSLLCVTCKKKIKIGDKVITKIGRPYKTRHESCARSVGVI